MASLPATTAENNTLFEIDAELEAKFDAATQEQEETGVISEETKQRCLDLFAELGKKVDRIARYVRATEFKAKAAKEEATRLAARQKSAKNRVAQVKSMLAFYMLSRGLRRLEGELNTINLQKNGQASVQVNQRTLSPEYNQLTIVLSQPDCARVLKAIASPELKKQLDTAVVRCAPDNDRIRRDLESGKEVPGTALMKGEHIRFA